MTGLLLIITGWFIKGIGLFMVSVGDLFIRSGTWINEAPGRLWAWLRGKK